MEILKSRWNIRAASANEGAINIPAGIYVVLHPPTILHLISTTTRGSSHASDRWLLVWLEFSDGTLLAGVFAILIHPEQVQKVYLRPP